jgi:DNA polymerase III delta prime subunit
LPLRDAVGARPQPRAPQMAAAVAAQTDKTETDDARAAREQRQPLPVGRRPHLGDAGQLQPPQDVAGARLLGAGESDLASEAFDRVFSLQPRQVDAEAPPALPLPDQWPVVQADATQTAAVALARTGTSYIIQGPPGTGKSQTITNLIADYVGRGQRVLFVCEKRAAIDVVFHRLRQQGLDELCCMIHDSQGDKKTFVQNLRKTYEQWLEAPEALTHESAERTRVLDAMALDLQALERFDAAMRDVPAHIAVTLRELVARLIALKAHDPALTPLQAEALPTFSAWRQHAELVSRLHLAVTESLGAPSLAQHVFAQLAPSLLKQERPLARLVELSERAAELSGTAAMRLSTHGRRCRTTRPRCGAMHWPWWPTHAASPRWRRAAIWPLLDGAHPSSVALGNALAQRRSLQQALDGTLQRTAHWRDRLSPTDTEAGLAQARTQQGSLLRWLQPSWWRLSGELKRRYDFAAHAVRPQPSQLLEDLLAEHTARAALTSRPRRSRPTTAAPTPRPSRSSCRRCAMWTTAPACARRSRRTCAPMPRALRARRSKSSPPPARAPTRSTPCGAICWTTPARSP